MLTIKDIFMNDLTRSIPKPDIAPPVANPTVPTHQLPPGSCDSHAHIFGPADSYPYAAQRSYTPHDSSLKSYAGLLHHLGFERAVLVQPSVYGTDNSLMVDALTSAHNDSLGIEWRGIAVLDDTVSDTELERFNNLGVRGVRLNLLYKGADLGFADVARLAERIAPLGWHMQFLINIASFENFAERLSRLPVASVVDHIGHFPATNGLELPQFLDLKELMKEGKSWVKVSGPNRISTHDTAPFTDAQILAQDLMEHVPNQLVFGTDWPHVQLSGSMPDDGMLVNEFYRWCENDETLAKRILVDNPKRLYSF